MAIYGDNKHNSEHAEHIDNRATYTVTLVFEGLDSKNPLAAAKKIAKWCKEGVDEMTFDVINEKTGEAFTVDLSEEDENAVLPNKG